MKLASLMDDFTKKHILGKVISCKYNLFVFNIDTTHHLTYTNICFFVIFGLSHVYD